MKRLVLFMALVLAYFGGLAQTPTVFAGIDSTMTMSPIGSSYNITGTDTAFVRGIVTGGSGFYTVFWYTSTGPNEPTWHHADQLEAYVSNMIPGTYIFHLLVTDIVSGVTVESAVKRVVEPCVDGGVQYEVTVGGDGGYLLADGSFIKPGSWLWMDSVLAPLRVFTYFGKLKGAPGCWIKIKARGLNVLINGAAFFNCEYTWWGGGTGSVIFTPMLHDSVNFLVRGHWKDTVGGVYQHYANQGSSGAAIFGNTREVKISNFYWTKNKYGCQAKIDETCDTMENYPNGLLYGVTFEKGYAGYNEAQDFYTGTTQPHNHAPPAPGGRAATPCNTYPDPGRAGKFTFYRIVADTSGRSNIQIAVAEVGYSLVRDCIARNAGAQTDEAQAANLFFGSYSRVIALHNLLRKSFAYNMQSFGKQTLAFDNICDSAGYGSTANRYVVGTDGVTPVGPKPDTATFLGSGAPMSFRATEFPDDGDSMQVILKGNTLSNAAIHNTFHGSGGEYIISYFSVNDLLTAGTTGWSYFNYTDNNTFNGSFIGPGSEFNHFKPAYTPPIHVVEKPLLVPPRISADRDMRIQKDWHLLHGEAETLEVGATTMTYKWVKVYGPAGDIIQNDNLIQTEVYNLQNGLYKYRLTVTDNLGTTISDEMNIEVSNVTPAPGITPFLRDFLIRHKGARLIFKY